MSLNIEFCWRKYYAGISKCSINSEVVTLLILAVLSGSWTKDILYPQKINVFFVPNKLALRPWIYFIFHLPATSPLFLSALLLLPPFSVCRSVSTCPLPFASGCWFSQLSFKPTQTIKTRRRQLDLDSLCGHLDSERFRFKT